MRLHRWPAAFDVPTVSVPGKIPKVPGSIGCREVKSPEQLFGEAPLTSEVVVEAGLIGCSLSTCVMYKSQVTCR